jgi:hypothetical protein
MSSPPPPPPSSPPPPPLGDVGWRGRFKHNSPEVVSLREQLQAEAGIKGLELISPEEPGFAQRAATIFHRDGFVIVKDALDAARLETIRGGCDHVIRQMVTLDPLRVGNRGSHRYSFASAPGFFGRSKDWAVLIDPPAVLAVVEAIFESPLFRCSGFGGDFVLPGTCSVSSVWPDVGFGFNALRAGCTEYQHLHRDMSDYLHDPSGRLDFIDMPCARVAVNYPMVVEPGSEVAHTAINGATRQIPGTQQSHAPIPSEGDEPRWMKLATTAPCPAGCAMLRDVVGVQPPFMISSCLGYCGVAHLMVMAGAARLARRNTEFVQVRAGNSIGCIRSTLVQSSGAGHRANLERPAHAAALGLAEAI